MTIAEEELQDRVAALIDEHEADGRASALHVFAAAYLQRHRADGASPEAVYHEIAGAFDLVASRGRRPASVRAFNPTAYECVGSVVEATTDDLPYLVDSIAAELQGAGLEVHRVVHPIIGTERDRDGRLLAVLRPRESARRESVMHFELDRCLDRSEEATSE